MYSKETSKMCNLKNNMDKDKSQAYGKINMFSILFKMWL